ncbi:MAG: ABC transporter permease [Micrococcaceae bacterium]
MSTSTVTTTDGKIPAGFVTPGKGAGLLDVWRRRQLLRLLVKKEISVRYRNSVLGLLWSYFKPMVIFVVQYIALGVILDRGGAVQNYALYMFCGNAIITYFSEAFGNAARSIVGNADLVKKIYLPRELFPIACTWVSAVHFLPALVVLLVGAVYSGWKPSFQALYASVFAFIIVTIFAIGLGLIAACLNVFFRDVENFVDLLLSILMWLSPVIYTWDLVAKQMPNWAFQIYMSNPITAAIELFHWAFWYPTIDHNPSNPALAHTLAPHLIHHGIVAFIISCATLAVGAFMFRRLEGKFAQEL